ncbi:phage tail tube protein [Kitasatospora viridis]|uniref:Uncharacterized protein n=1 Tax=Kitasatospora viridis TaxID=281105 RepID=A0A561UKM3_9ACTN|nr:hypothetical protein [Kitasatospora viridis]TWF99910.1 hypothetical protein FHX73_113770 [Kitasatospora viridis]
MATRRIEARGWSVQIAVGATPTWTPVAGLKSLTYNPGDKATQTDATDFDSQGQYEEVVLQRGATMKLDGTRRIDPATGLPDPGQGALDALAQGLGDTSTGQIRFRYRTETQWRVWTVTATAAEQGGATNDLSKWGMVLTRCGAETYVSAP